MIVRDMRWRPLLLNCSGLSIAATALNVETVTRNWVNRVVVGKRLCPWAKKAVELDEFKVQVLPNFTERDWFNADASKKGPLISTVLKEAKLLARPQNIGATTLIVLPSFAPSRFDAYLDLVEGVQDLINTERLSKFVQMASFHPQYQFAGTEVEAAENYTNRSPFPILHLLRVADMTKAIKNFEDQTGKTTDAIWQANIETMRSMGVEDCRTLFNSLLTAEGSPSSRKQEDKL